VTRLHTKAKIFWVRHEPMHAEALRFGEQETDTLGEKYITA